MKTTIATALMFGITCLGSAMASASTVGFASNGTSQSDLGTFGGNFSYTYNNATSKGQLTLSLTNTSDASGGGYLTGFGFNINSSSLISLSLLSQTSNAPENVAPAFGLMSSAKATPYGTFDWALTLTKANGNLDFNGSGSPSAGIAIAETRNFVFDVIGSSASGLLATDFTSQKTTSSSGSGALIGRFRGFDNGGSDKVLGDFVPTSPGQGADVPLAVPLPATSLGAAALMAVTLLGRRSRNFEIISHSKS